VLNGLHAAHEATNEQGEPLNIIHRDVSPQNILVGSDGVARLLDFGVAKAAGTVHPTRDGQLKGKVAYMAPEQIRGQVTRATDIYASGIVLWEALTGRRLFAGESETEVMAKVLDGVIEPPSRYAPTLPHAVDELVMRALERDPTRRFATAREMARTLEKSLPLVSTSDVGEWVEHAAGASLADRRKRVATIESAPSIPPPVERSSGSELQHPRIPSTPAEAPVDRHEATIATIPTALSSSAITDPLRTDPALPGQKTTTLLMIAVGVGMAGLLLAAIGLGRRRASEAAETTAIVAATASAFDVPPAESVEPSPPPAAAVPTAEPLASPSAAASSAPPHPSATHAAASAAPRPSPAGKSAPPATTKKGYGSALDTRR
jgi:serine/threonine-protein kinase